MKNSNDNMLYPISFRADESIKEGLRNASIDERRSVSSMITIIIEDWLAQKGYLPAKETKK